MRTCSRASSNEADDADGHLERVELGGEVVIGGDGKGTPAAVAMALARSSVCSTTPAPANGQGLGREVGRDRFVDEQRLGGIADAGPVGLRVHRDRERLVEVGGAVDIDVTVPMPVSITGTVEFKTTELIRSAPPRGISRSTRPRVVISARTASWPPSIRPMASGLTPCAAKGFAHDVHEDTVGVGCRRAAAQDHGVARFQPQAGSVDSDIGAGFVDHSDDTHRDADLPDLQAVGGVERTISPTGSGNAAMSRGASAIAVTRSGVRAGAILKAGWHTAVATALGSTAFAATMRSVAAPRASARALQRYVASRRRDINAVRGPRLRPRTTNCATASVASGKHSSYGKGVRATRARAHRVRLCEVVAHAGRRNAPVLGRTLPCLVRRSPSPLQRPPL